MIFLVPERPVLPCGVNIAISTRLGGTSTTPYASLNMGTHVGDAPERVAANHQIFANALAQRFGNAPHLNWLSQVHGTNIVTVKQQFKQLTEADGAYTQEAGQVCAVLTADCLPVLLCSDDGSEVAAVHAGWRGLAQGILAWALAKFRSPPNKLMCYLGPAISQRAFQVGSDVVAAFKRAESERSFAESASLAFVDDVNEPGKHFADIYRLARSELYGLGVNDIAGGQFCTYLDEQRFFSYRRDGVSGRMASMIWINA